MLAWLQSRDAIVVGPGLAGVVAGVALFAYCATLAARRIRAGRTREGIATIVGGSLWACALAFGAPLALGVVLIAKESGGVDRKLVMVSLVAIAALPRVLAGLAFWRGGQ